MNAKINKYIKAAEKLYLTEKQQGIELSIDRLEFYLDIEVIPCCSMSKDDQKELKVGLGEMVRKNKSQPKLF